MGFSGFGAGRLGVDSVKGGVWPIYTKCAHAHLHLVVAVGVQVGEGKEEREMEGGGPGQHRLDSHFGLRAMICLQSGIQKVRGCGWFRR